VANPAVPQGALLRGMAWRAVNEHGAELDNLMQKRCDKAAAKRFFTRLLRLSPVPRKIVTDPRRSYPAAKAETPELEDASVACAAFSPATYTEIPLVLQANPAIFRAQAAPAARVTLSQTTRSPVRCTARFLRTRPKSVDRFLF
jgi:hypothetical protein